MLNFTPTSCSLSVSPADSDEVLIALRGDKLVLTAGAVLPTGAEWPIAVERLTIGRLGDKRCSALVLSQDAALPESLGEWELREARLHLSPSAEIAVCRARELAFWRRNHRYCGACAAPLVDLENECARKCPGCGALFYPVISPAIIVAVTDGQGRLLLAHNSKFRNHMHSLIAGFVESGETLEGAVHREVWEEVGLRVRNVRYFHSQSWPYPNSLMAGFTAEYESGELKPDGNEILCADFYTPETIPVIPQPGSIARELIDRWREFYRKDRE